MIKIADNDEWIDSLQAEDRCIEQVKGRIRVKVWWDKLSNFVFLAVVTISSWFGLSWTFTFTLLFHHPFENEFGLEYYIQGKYHPPVCWEFMGYLPVNMVMIIFDPILIIIVLPSQTNLLCISWPFKVRRLSPQITQNLLRITTFIINKAVI